MEDVRALLILNDPRHDSCAEVKDIAITHLKQVRHKLADLTRLESILSASIDGYTREPLAPCAVLDMLEL